MRNEFREAEERSQERYQQGDLKRAVPRQRIDVQDLCLYRGWLLGDPGVELGVGHHLGVVLQRLGDLPLLGLGDDAASPAPGA